jgi:pimeloyl-ACP methyl ester carboxylesterase
MTTVRTGSEEADWLVGDDGVRLWVRRTGPADAPPVLLVHGYPDNSSVWDGVAARLAERHRVIRYDVRGHGRSQAPDSRPGYGLDHLAADVAAVVRTAGAPVHLVAHDWGSIQSWHAVTEPSLAPLFASYTSISGPCLDHVAFWMRDKLHTDRLTALNQLRHSWYIGMFRLPVVPEFVWSLPPMRQAFGAELRDAVHGLELYRANILAGRKPGKRPTDVPVQQLALARDAFVTPPLLTAAEPWCSRLWRRPLDLPHWAPREDPAAVAEAVAEFVGHATGDRPSVALDAARVGRRS